MWLRTRVPALVVLAGTLCVGSALAQRSEREAGARDNRDTGTYEAGRADRSGPMRGQQQARFEGLPGERGPAYSPNLRKASDVIGDDLVDVNGESVGSIDDLAIDADHNVVAYAIVSRGGLLGIGEKLVPVPFKAVHARGDRLVLQTEKKLLDRIPEVQDTRSFSDLADPSEARAIHGQFAMQPYWRPGSQAGSRGPRPEPQFERRSQRGDIYGYEADRARRDGFDRQAPPSGRQMDDADLWYEEEYEQRGGMQGRDGRVEWQADQGRVEMRGQRQPRPDQDYGYGGDRNRYRDDSYGYRDEPYGYRDRPYMDREARRGTGLRAPSAGPGQMISAGRLMGDDIEGRYDEPVGELEDLMVDMNSGAIGYAVISDATDSRDEYVVVPWNAFGIRRYQDETRLNLRVSQGQLRNAPSFDRDAWPDMASADWTRRVHDYYGVEPTWAYYGYVEDTGRTQIPEVKFDTENVQTMQGTVEDMSRHGRVGSHSGIVMLRIKVSPGQEQQAERPAATQPAQAQAGREQAAEGQMVTAYLAPVSFLREHELGFRRGETVKLEGSEIDVDGRTALLVSKVTKEGRTVELRNEQGEPLWTRGRAGQERFHQNR